jgi:hypothetical protein
MIAPVTDESLGRPKTKADPIASAKARLSSGFCMPAVLLSRVSEHYLNILSAELVASDVDH